MSPSSSLVQDTGLSRRQQGFKSPWGRFFNPSGIKNSRRVFLYVRRAGIMIITVDSKIHKLCNRQLEDIPEKKLMRYSVNEIARHITENRDCLLVTTPASLKTQLLFAIANINPCHQKMRIVLPVVRSFLSYSYALDHISIQSYDSYLNDSNKQCAILFVDEGERIDDPIEGERLESLLIESDPESPLVLAMNARSNVAEVAKWLSNIRNRKCMVIYAQGPKSIIPTFFTHNGEWLPLLDKKKLNRKVKNHLKTINKPISLRKIFFQCLDLVNAQKLSPAIFVLSEMTAAIDLWNKHPEKESKPGQYMTAPAIVRIIGDNPSLKDNPFVIEMLKKRAGICFNNRIWLQLIENLFSMGAFDIILATTETIQQLYISSKSLILMGHPKHNTKNTDISLQLWYDQLLMRSGQYDNFLDETKKQTVFCILTDSPDVSPVHVKDFLDTGLFSLQSHFKWRMKNILRRISRNRSILNDLNKSFLVASQGARNNVLFHDAIMEIQAELPQAKCLPVSAMSFLNSIRIKWTNELAEYRKQIKLTSNKCLETTFQKTKFLLDCLPCNDCDHASICHHRGSKRFREMIDLFYAYLTDSANRHLLLETTAPCFFDLLQQLDWIDFNKKLTPKGNLAYQLGPLVNPLFVECLFNNMIPVDKPRLGAAILAGFLPDKWAFPTHVDLRYPAISTIYQTIWPHLKESSQTMLALGLYPRIPDYQLSCLYYSLTATDDRTILMEQTNLNQMTVELFVSQVDRQFSRIQDSHAATQSMDSSRSIN